MYNIFMIEIRDLQKVQSGKTILDISLLELSAGEISALVGPVDSGMDTLFQLLIGQIRPTSGLIKLSGLVPYLDREAFSRKVGVMFSEQNLYKRLSVMDNLQFFGRLYRLPAARASQVLEQVGLADQARTIAGSLPPSLFKRLALGRALLNHPEILVLADPLSGCDQASVNLICQVIRKESDEGATVLILAKEISQLDTLCDRIYILDQGRITDSFDPGQQQNLHKPFMVPARSEDRIILVDPAEILYAFAQDDRAFLQTSDGRLSTQFTLADLEKRLVRRGFFRAHRGFLVNLQQVKEVIPFTRDSFSLRLKDKEGTEIPLSKSAERELRDLLEY